jgi:acid phosphatase class B
MEGDKKINRKISPIFNLKENENKETGYQLKLNSEKKIEVVSKDKIGNPSVYRTTITVNFDIFDDNKIIKSKIFLTSFTYNSNKNKFDYGYFFFKIKFGIYYATKKGT